MTQKYFFRRHLVERAAHSMIRWHSCEDCGTGHLLTSPLAELQHRLLTVEVRCHAVDVEARQPRVKHGGSVRRPYMSLAKNVGGRVGIKEKF